MKLIITSLSVSIVAFFSQAFIALEFSDTIIGSWAYQYSITDSTHTKLENENICPVEKMIFKKCEDKNELRQMPSVVRSQRKNNVLKDICCETYNKDKFIDKYFPVAQRLDTTYTVFNYGSRFKSTYYIEKISKDTLVIFDEKNRNINGRSYTGLRHVYVKRS